MKREIVSIAVMLMLFVSMFLSLPLVSAAYTIENPFMPPDSGDLEPVCAMKTGTGTIAYFYIPHIDVSRLKIELLFDDNLIGDQTGETSPYPEIQNYPDKTVDMADVTVVTSSYRAYEGDANWNYMADIQPNGYIDISDVVAVTSHYRNTGDYSYNLSGVSVTFDTGEEIWPDNGFVTIPDGATTFTVKQNGNSVAAMIIFFGICAPPIAYSTTFEFNVPNDGNKEVWYYILARLYVPQELAGKNLYFVASADDSVQNVKLNAQSKAGSGSSVNISLGSLCKGYHLLEFEFVEIWGGGSLNFHVATTAEEYAWLSRFRIYVPNYSEEPYEYAVKTETWCPILDDYFLIGYADDYIDDVGVDGTVWQDWEWDMGEYTIYAWGDGFCYPLGRLPKEELYDVSFSFGERWAAGLLDFQYVSWTHQRDRIGNPRFYAVGNLNQGDYITINSAMLYGGSKWKFEEDPQFSERYFEARQVINASYDDEETWFDACLEIGLGLGWAEWALLPATEDDVGITVNFTATHFATNRRDHMDMGFWFELDLEDPTIDIYSFPALEIEGLEYQEHDSFVKPDLTSAIDYAGTVIMFVSSTVGEPIGALTGLAIKGCAAAIRITEGQHVSRFEEIITDEHHYQVLRNYDLDVSSPPEGEIRAASDIIFFKLDPVAGKHCGLTQVVLHGTLVAEQWFIGGPGTGPLRVWSAPIADITITLCIPWFLRG